MPDREKVIDKLQDMVNDEWMWRHADDYARTVENAIKLLKGQAEIIERTKADFKTIEDNLNSALAYERKLNQQILGRLDVYQGIMRMILKMLIEEVKERKSE